MAAEEDISRTILPIPDRKFVGLTTYDAKDPDTKYPPIKALRPPKQAPNVIILLAGKNKNAPAAARPKPVSRPNL